MAPRTVFGRGALLPVLVLLLVAGLAAGCSPEGADPERAGEDVVVPVPEDAERYLDEGAGDGEAAADLGTAEVEVRLFDRTLEMPDVLPQGRTVFVITNTGDVPHNFEIEGRGLEAELEEPLQPGDTARLAVELTAGDYTVYCPVGDHREEGMVRSLRVTR